VAGHSTGMVMAETFSFIKVFVGIQKNVLPYSVYYKSINTCITASFLQNTEQCNGVLNIKIKIKILHNNPIGSEFYLLALFNMTTENYKITTNVSNFVLMTKCSLW
jgi:hypothetical protein